MKQVVLLTSLALLMCGVFTSTSEAAAQPVPSISLNGYEGLASRLFTSENASLYGTVGSFGSPWGPPQPDIFASAFPYDGSGLWQITLVPPVGTPLVPGTYANAGGFDAGPFQPALVTQHAGGGMCTGGNFRIAWLDATNPYAIRFDVSWSQDCAGVPVSGRAVFGANAPPIGFHDGDDGISPYGTCVANGWAEDPDDPTRNVTVRVLADGNQVATGVASDFRQDLLDAGIGGDGTAAFTVQLGGVIASDVEHEIRVEAQDVESGEWVDLSSTPRRMTCTLLAGFHDGNSGVVNRSSCVANGWAFDADTPTGPRVEVRIKVDGVVVAETTAKLYREDLRDAGIGDGYSGWAVNLFGRLTPNREHLVTAEARDTDAKRIWVPLANTPLRMKCVPGP